MTRPAHPPVLPHALSHPRLIVTVKTDGISGGYTVKAEPRIAHELEHARGYLEKVGKELCKRGYDAESIGSVVTDCNTNALELDIRYRNSTQPRLNEAEMKELVSAIHSNVTGISVEDKPGEKDVAATRTITPPRQIT